MQSAEQSSAATTPDQPADAPVRAADPAGAGSSHNGESVTKQEMGFHYSREELVRISKLPASNVRPAFLKAECNNETTGVWSPWKHEKYEQNGWNNSSRTASTGSAFSGRSAGDADTGKTRLGPQNPGNWIRGCDPKMQESKPVTDATSQSNGNKNTTSELSVPPGLRVAPDKRPVPARAANPLHGDWRSDKHTGRPDLHRMEAAGGRFGHPEFDSRSRGGQRTLSFNNKNPDRSGHFSNNHNTQHRNNYEETPEWMSEPTSKFEMMNLGGFADDTRGSPEEAPDRRPAAGSSPPADRREERSSTPDFERMMKDMLNFTDEDSVTEIPVTLPEADSGSKSAKWFGGRPEYEQQQQRRHAGQNDLMQILQRANISLNQVQGQQPHLPKVVQSLHEIEAGLRSDPSPGAEDKQAFNKLLDLLSRRSAGQQQPAQQFAAPPPGRPSSYEIEEMNRQRKLLEAHTDQPDMQQKGSRQFPPAFSMVPIQVIRNATATDRRGLLPHESDPNTQPRAITGSAQSHAMQRPARLPASPFGPEFDMQRQAMIQQSRMSPAMAGRPPLSAQQLQQLQQLQMMNQQLHQLNPGQLQQTRGMSAAQIQQFLLRSAQ